ncbi:hypothetical protein D3C71_1235770 [compost metagenome]
MHQPANRVAGQAEVVFHADLRGVFHLLHGAAKHFAQSPGGHGAGHADFALTADFSARDRSVFLVQNADGRSGQQKTHDAVVIRGRDKSHVVMQHGGNDSGRAVGWRGDHASTVGIFFVDRQGVQVDPIQH